MHKERLVKKRVRLPSSKVAIHYERASGHKAHCAVLGTPLQGVAYGKYSKVEKLSKTQKRPSVVLGGILSSKARDIIFEEAIKVKLGLKELDAVRLSYREYVLQAIGSISL